MEIRMERELRRAQCEIHIMSDRMEMMEAKTRKGPPSEMEEHGGRAAGAVALAGAAVAAVLVLKMSVVCRGV